MRYALISDIHANLPALEAVMADIGTRGTVGATYHLADLVGYAPWPDEVAALIAGSGMPGVAGNYDSTVGTDYKHCGCRYEDPRQEELSHLNYAWTRSRDAAHQSGPRGPALSHRPRARRRPPGRTPRGPGPRGAHTQHALLDGGPLG